jgi:uncharacterized protein (DUF1697 family)
MPRYAAFLRAVSPTNANMPDLKRAFEAAGFKNVRTVLATGNVVFDASRASDASLERKAEAAMSKVLGRTFFTIVRPVDALQQLLAADPYGAFQLASDAKRVVTFSRGAFRPAAQFPIERDGARILSVAGREAFTVYVSTPKGPVFMMLIEKTFGTEVTTRTWETVRKVARA